MMIVSSPTVSDRFLSEIDLRCCFVVDSVIDSSEWFGFDLSGNI